jgi:type I restriction enzyme S subunit
MKPANKTEFERTEVEIVPNGWGVNTLGDLTENHDSKRVPIRESDRKAGPYAYYGASGVIDHVSDYLFDGEYLLIAEDGENLRTRLTPIAFLADGKFWVNNHAHVVRGNGNADTRFLMYALLVANIDAFLTGTTMPKLTQRSMDAISIPCPPLPEQSAIAKILSDLDWKAALNQQMNITLETMGRAIFKEWFIDFEFPNDERLPYRSSGGEMVYNKDLNRKVPQGWAVERLEQLTETIFSGGTPDTRRDEYWNGNYPWLSSGETSSRFIVRTEKTITEQGIQNSSTRMAKSGDVVIASAGQGKTRGQTSLSLIDTYINQSIIALRPKRDVVTNSFLFFELSMRYPELRALSDSSSIRGSLTTRIFKDLKMVVPPLNNLSTFDQWWTHALRRIHSNLIENGALGQIRDALLPKLMSGKIRVPVEVR